MASLRALLNCNVSGEVPMFYSFDREGEREYLINVGGLFFPIHAFKQNL